MFSRRYVPDAAAQSEKSVKHLVRRDVGGSGCEASLAVGLSHDRPKLETSGQTDGGVRDPRRTFVGPRVWIPVGRSTLVQAFVQHPREPHRRQVHSLLRERKVPIEVLLAKLCT
jgi:hypothetical protein